MCKVRFNVGGGWWGEGSPALPLDPPLQVDKYKEIIGLDVYSLDISNIKH